MGFEKLFLDDGICKPTRILSCLDCTEATYGLTMYLAGPFFVLCALTIVASVSYVGFFVLLPLRAEVFSLKWWIIVIVGLYFLFNIMFHYVLCVFSNPGTHDSKYFDRAVQEAMDQGITLLYEDPDKGVITTPTETRK